MTEFESVVDCISDHNLTDCLFSPFLPHTPLPSPTSTFFITLLSNQVGYNRSRSLMLQITLVIIVQYGERVDIRA